MISKLVKWLGQSTSLKYYAMAALAAIAVASSTLLYISHQRNTIESLENQVEQQKKKIKELNDQAAIQASGIESLENLLKTQQALTEAARKEVEFRLLELAALQEQYEALRRGLPKPLTRQQEPPQTPKQEENSRRRIITLWKAYCGNGRTSSVCEEMKP